MLLLKKKVGKIVSLCVLLVFTISVPLIGFTAKFSPSEGSSVAFYKEINDSDIVWIYNLTGEWHGGYGINIDDTDPWSNWSYYASNYDWVSGAGTSGDPYLLTNVLIDGLGQETNLITIKNSNAVFRIEDCILYNTDYYYWDESRCNAIYFDNVENGWVENVETYNCMNGIRLKNSQRNTIQKTWAMNHYTSGIVVSGGSQNKIRNNTISEESGIRLVDGTFNNDVKKNIIFSGTYMNNGIHLSNS
ncbi:MAG: right-handed parallel beta-helix repeat-containing protein, partial [Candidatus Hermodarchaeota archaeon]